MAPEIQVLPDLIINQIAAGEVVERPASVVKELVENALDAGASHIFVEIEAGGKTRIRVLDNGSGMSKVGVELALQRHATSKLRAVSELFGISTFGFRGEALPSIAAVSKMTITTREREGGDAAQRVQIEGGTIVERSLVGAPVGTCIEVCDLLYNVPARQKFMKGEATETSHITETMNKLALANPQVHFRLKNRSRTTINAPRHEMVEDRVMSIMGARLGNSMQGFAGEVGGVIVDVYLGAPELAQSTTRALQIFVGKRPIRDRGILSAVMQGYGERIPSGRYPAAVVLIRIPDGEVDVNVHPQKLEVRFSDPQLVYAAVRQVVRSGVDEACWTLATQETQQGISMRAITASAPPRIDAFARAKLGEQVGQTPASQLAVNYAQEHAKRMLPGGRGLDVLTRSGRKVDARGGHAGSSEKSTSYQRPGHSDASPAQVIAEGSGPKQTQTDRGAREELGASGEAFESEGFFSSLRYLGQLDRTYLLCEALGELVMLDQHAAHERVELHKLRTQYRTDNIAIQRMLFPQRVELSPSQAVAADTHGVELAQMGFEMDDFGDGGGTLSYALKAVPAGLRESDPVSVLLTLLDELAKTGSGRALDAKVESMLATLACHSVVRSGDSLGAEEVQSLLRAMDEVDFREPSPHGRPVLLRIGLDEIGRRFGR